MPNVYEKGPSKKWCPPSKHSVEVDSSEESNDEPCTSAISSKPAKENDQKKKLVKKKDLPCYEPNFNGIIVSY